MKSQPKTRKVKKTVKRDLDSGLYDLTEQIALRTEANTSHGVLGGMWGYGAEYENDTFMMHPYCWCEREDCKWCGGNAGPISVHSGYFTDGPQNDEAGLAPNFLYKPTGAKVWWYKYIGRGVEETGELPDDWYEKCVASLPKSSK